MRIIQIITLCELGGAQSVVANLSNRLCEEHEVIVVAGEGDGKMFDLLSPKIKVERIPSLVRRLSPFDELRTIRAMMKLNKKYHPDIVHLHSSKAGLLGRIAFPSSKIVYTVHGFDSIRLAYRKFLPLERLLQRKCASIVGVSKYDEKNLKLERITNNVSTVYNGIYESGELSLDPFAELKGTKGRVLCIARVSKQKRLDLFLEVAKRMPEYSFIWIGNQHTPDFEIPTNVHFMGNIPDAGRYAAYADVFLLPSNYEGLPMVIIEALSKGVPVVASAVGGISELLDGTNGFAVENDANTMAEAILKIYNSSKEEYARMSESARNTYLDKFTVNHMVKGYLSIYNEIIKRNHRN